MTNEEAQLLRLSRNTPWLILKLTHTPYCSPSHGAISVACFCAAPVRQHSLLFWACVCHMMRSFAKSTNRPSLLGASWILTKVTWTLCRRSAFRKLSPTNSNIPKVKFKVSHKPCLVYRLLNPTTKLTMRSSRCYCSWDQSSFQTLMIKEECNKDIVPSYSLEKYNSYECMHITSYFLNYYWYLTL